VERLWQKFDPKARLDEFVERAPDNFDKNTSLVTNAGRIIRKFEKEYG
jgi:hypothetical protein